jgi:hypothetical protein
MSSSNSLGLLIDSVSLITLAFRALMLDPRPRQRPLLRPFPRSFPFPEEFLWI